MITPHGASTPPRAISIACAIVTPNSHSLTSSHRAPSVGILAVLAILLLAPMVALSLSPWHANASLWYLGMLPVVIGLFANARVGFAAAIVTPVLMGLSLLLRDLPIVGALYMAAVAVATGFAALRGWNMMLSFAGPLSAFALIGDPQVALPSGTAEAASSVTSGLVVVGFVLTGGLWTAVWGQFVIRALHMKPPRTYPLHTAGYYAAALGVLVGIATYIDMALLDAADSWWMILTFYVVVQPYYSDALRRVSARVIGTILGALLAVVVVTMFQNLPAVITALALVLAVGAAWANVNLPYWAFVLFLTPAVVLQTAGGTEAIFDSIVARAAYTVIGAAAAIIVLAIGHRFVVPKKDRHREPDTRV